MAKTAPQHKQDGLGALPLRDRCSSNPCGNPYCGIEIAPSTTSCVLADSPCPCPQPTTCFETFPWPPGTEPTDDPRVIAIAQAAKELNDKREAWLNPPGLAESELKKRTLTNLYNARPTWLDLAHKKLDAAVAAAYGWPADLPDDEILARVLALNLERAGGKAS